MAAAQALWVEEEYLQLSALYRVGIPVPQPLGFAGKVIIMEFIGDGGEPAPRLCDLRLSQADTAAAFDQSVAHLLRMVDQGLAHGDYSTYNLLWHRGRVVVIDLPQVIDLATSPNALEMVRRDLESLCASFRQLGHPSDPESIWQHLEEETKMLLYR
jgi:RIO kinase 1